MLEFRVDIGGRRPPVDNHKAIKLIANFLAAYAHQSICLHCQLPRRATEIDVFDGGLLVRKCVDPQIRDYIDRVVRDGTLEWLYNDLLKCYTVQFIGDDDEQNVLAEYRFLLDEVKVITRMRGTINRFLEIRKKFHELLKDLQMEEPNPAIANGNYRTIALKIICTLEKKKSKKKKKRKLKSKYDEEVWEIVPGNFGKLPLTNKCMKEDRAASFETKALKMKLYKR